MKRSRDILAALCLALGMLRPVCAQQSGTLIFDLKNYTSVAKIPKNVLKQLQHAGVYWGVLGNTLVIPFVNEKFVNADTPYLTRFGEQKSLELKPGQYSITCIGYEFDSTSSDPDKQLAKSAFFNSDVLTFTVLAGKTTTLDISPVIIPEAQWKGFARLSVFMPELRVRVIEDGEPKGEEVPINRRGDHSVAWNAYHGPLKF
jgi:hypothetical protein